MMTPVTGLASSPTANVLEPTSCPSPPKSMSPSSAPAPQASARRGRWKIPASLRSCWNPMIDAISTYVNGSELDSVSILDMDAYEDTEINWRLRRGYGALMAAYGARCPLALDTQVTLIDHSGTRVRIETSRGTLWAGKVIVTVPTNLIADGTGRL